MSEQALYFYVFKSYLFVHYNICIMEMTAFPMHWFQFQYDLTIVTTELQDSELSSADLYY